MTLTFSGCSEKLEFSAPCPPGWYRVDMTLKSPPQLRTIVFDLASDYSSRTLRTTAVSFPIKSNKTYALVRTEFPTTRIEFLADTKHQTKIEGSLTPLDRKALLLEVGIATLRFPFLRAKIGSYLHQGWKILKATYGRKNALRSLGKSIIQNTCLPEEYATWISLVESPRVDAPKQKILFLMLVDPQGEWKRSLSSLLNQESQNWELKLITAESPLKGETDDPRVEGLSLERFLLAPSAFWSSWDWISVLTPGNEIAKQTSFYPHFSGLDSPTEKDPEPSIFYCDEDWLTSAHQRCRPEFKPDWDPDYFFSYDYLSEILFFKPKLLDSNWLAPSLPKFMEDRTYRHRLIFAAMEQNAKIAHSPQIGNHCRQKERASPQVLMNLMNEFFDQHQSPNSPNRIAEIERLPNLFRVRYSLPNSSPLVSLIICTRNRVDLLEPLVNGILNQTSYKNFEILIVDNQSDDPATLGYFDRLKAQSLAQILHYPKPFNFADMNNFAVRNSKGSLIAFLNNDLRIIKEDWLSELVSQALRPDVGAVGAKLYHESRTIQHAGVILGIGWGAGHLHRLTQGTSRGYLNRLLCTQNFSAVTAACLVMRKDRFEEVGCFDSEDFSVGFNDVDLCLKLRSIGYQVIYTPYAELLHLESISRGSDMTGEKFERFEREVKALHRKWGNLLASDPFYNPNLSLNDENPRLAFPPRALSKTHSIRR